MVDRDENMKQQHIRFQTTNQIVKKQHLKSEENTKNSTQRQVFMKYNRQKELQVLTNAASKTLSAAAMRRSKETMEPELKLFNGNGRRYNR